MRRGVAVFTSALAACSAANGDFDPQATSAASGATQGATSVDTNGQTNDGPSGGADSSPATEGADGGSSGVSDECPLAPPAPIHFSISANGAVVPPNCQSGVLDSKIGLVQYPPPDIIQIEQCQIGACEVCQGDTIEIDFEGSLELPQPLITCAEFSAWATEGDDGCQWRGLVLFADEGTGRFPAFIASSQLQVPPVPEVKVELRGIGPCGTDEPGNCDLRRPGRYALLVADQLVTVEDSPVDVSLESQGDGRIFEYEVRNLMAQLTPNCRRQVAWTARYLMD